MDAKEAAPQIGHGVLCCFDRANPGEFNRNEPGGQSNRCRRPARFSFGNARGGLRAAQKRALFRLSGASYFSSQPRPDRTVPGVDRTLKASLIIILAAAFLFFGMPYYHAYKRRQKLNEKEKSRGDEE
jgi:hypothetical protein